MACFLEPKGLVQILPLWLSSTLTLEESLGLSLPRLPAAVDVCPRESLRVCGYLVINPLMAYGKDWNLVEKKIGAAP